MKKKVLSIYNAKSKKTNKKNKSIGIEFAPLHYNFTTKTVINHQFILKNSFQEILYKIDNWINEGSGCIIELIKFIH